MIAISNKFEKQNEMEYNITRDQLLTLYHIRWFFHDCNVWNLPSQQTIYVDPMLVHYWPNAYAAWTIIKPALIQHLAFTVVPVVAVVLWSVAASSAGGVEGRRGAAAGSAGGSVEDWGHQVAPPQTVETHPPPWSCAFVGPASSSAVPAAAAAAAVQGALAAPN